MEKQWKTEDELSEAINALMYRIDSLTAKSVTQDIASDSVNIEVQESAFRNTVREIFGVDSQEFSEFGNAQMLQGPLRVGMSPSDVAQTRLRGRDYMVHVCVELITRLQQKIFALRRKCEADVLSPQPDELHPIIDRATQELIATRHFWEAVFAASKALVLHIKDRSGRHDLDGVQ